MEVVQEWEDGQETDEAQLLAKMLRFSGHLGLACVDLGILPEPHDANVPPDFYNLQASTAPSVDMTQQYQGLGLHNRQQGA